MKWSSVFKISTVKIALKAGTLVMDQKFLLKPVAKSTDSDATLGYEILVY